MVGIGLPWAIVLGEVLLLFFIVGVKGISGGVNQSDGVLGFCKSSVKEDQVSAWRDLPHVF